MFQRRVLEISGEQLLQDSDFQKAKLKLSDVRREMKKSAARAASE